MNVVVRAMAWAAIAAMPMVTWWLAMSVQETWGTQRGPWQVEDAVALAVLGAGAVVAAYLTFTAAAMVLGSVVRGGRGIPRMMAALAPEAWRRVTATALGVGIAAGGAGPALAISPHGPESGMPAHAGAPAVAWAQAPHAAPADAVPSAPPAAAGVTARVGWLATPDATPVEYVDAAVAWRAPAVAEPSGRAATAPTATPDDRLATVVVVPGDCLWDIAARLLGDEADTTSVARAWPALYEANRDLIGADPDIIQPGQLLTVPAEVWS